MPSTSPIAAGIAVEGLLIQVGNTASPIGYNTVANISEYDLPATADKVDVTNVGMRWKSHMATLLDLGTIKLKFFWVMRDVSQENLITGAIEGVRYIYNNRILASWKVVYPDAGQSVDTFDAYVTKFNVSAKVGGVFEAEVELSQSALFNSPVLC